MRIASRLIICLVLALAIILNPVSIFAQAAEPLPPVITLDDVPDGFVMDDELTESTDALDPDTETGFGFTDEENGVLLYGMTLAFTPEDFDYLEELIADPDEYLDYFVSDSGIVPDAIRGAVVRHKTIGDSSLIVSADHYYEDEAAYLADEFGETERVEQVLFTVGDIAAMVILGYPVTNPPSFSIQYVGSLWAERIAAASIETADEADETKADRPKLTAKATATPTVTPTPIATPIATPVSTSELPLLVLDNLSSDFIIATDDEVEDLIGELDMDEVAEPLGGSAYLSEFEQEVIIGVLFDLQDPVTRLASSVITANPSVFLDAMVETGQFDASSVEVALGSEIDVGDASAAFSMIVPAGDESEFLLDMQFEFLWFEQDAYAGMLMLFYPLEESPEYTISELAGIWEAQIENAPARSEGDVSEDAVSAEQADATILAAALNVRTGPGTGYDRIGSLEDGDSVSVTGRNSDCSWVEIELADLENGWISASPSYVELHIDCDKVAVLSVRPNTGLLVEHFAALGWGELEIDNGSRHDQVVLLTDLDENVIAAAYVRNDDIYTMEDIPEGEYLVYFAAGSEWNEEENMFDRVTSYSMFEDTFDFVIEGDQVSTWSITLHTVVDGNADTPDVDAEDFPTLD